MGLKITFFCLLFLTVSQVLAISELHIRSLEVLGSRQATCPSCATVADTAGNCSTVACVCNPTVAADVQNCVNCAYASNPSPAVISSVQDLLDVYARTCSGVAGVPAITTPAGFPSRTSTPSGGTVVPPTTTITRAQTLSTTYTPPPVQSTVGSDTTTSLPPLVSQSGSGYKRRQAVFAVIGGALLGAALVM